jgi:GTP-binding protein
MFVKAGDGGHGCISFLRLKDMPFGGPDGGDGGRGGSIWLEADRDLLTLIDLKGRRQVVAARGGNGGGKNCSGRSGEDIVVKVPLGTTAVDADTGEELGDLVEHGQRLRVAKGGDGGRGNQHFATATNKAPRKADDGWPGEERNLQLELKIIADVGFVGLPNAGKSTLLAAMTNANPKIAPYPFTTLHPNLGVFLASDFQRRVVLADIPGLIEGAHTGAGLGHRFLRHIERTRILVHLVAPEAAGDDADGGMTLADASLETMLYAHDLVLNELRSYSDTLPDKPRVVCINKADLLTEEEKRELVAGFQRERGVRALVISAKGGDGLDDLRAVIEQVVLQFPEAPGRELPKEKARRPRQFENREAAE